MQCRRGREWATATSPSSDSPQRRGSARTIAAEYEIRALHGLGPEGLFGPGAAGANIYQDTAVATRPGDVIVASAWVRSAGATTSGAFGVQAFGGAQYNEVNCQTYTVDASGWQHVQVVLNPNSAHTGARVERRATPNAGTTLIDTTSLHK